MACNQCPGSIATNNPIAKELFCVQNLYMILSYVVGGVTASISAWYASFYNWNGYTPFAFSSETPGYKMNIIETSVRMEGTSEGDLMIASPLGSEIFAKGGLNYVKLGAGADKVYHSLCSTEIKGNIFIGKKTGVIDGFNISEDKLVFFCSKNDVKPENIHIIHGIVNNVDITYIEVYGNEKYSAIALLGDIPLQVSDIELNQRWDPS